MNRFADKSQTQGRMENSGCGAGAVSDAVGYTILLASASPRRRELLDQIGLSFRTVPADVEEKTHSQKPWEMVEELSALKARAVLERIPENDTRAEDAAGGAPGAGEGASAPFVVIGADTVVALGERIMGKPRDRQDALEMLTLLQGQTHQVYTGVTLLFQDGRTREEARRITFHEKTDVTMYPMSRREIEAYVDCGEPMDKAGAYGIQGRCAAFIRGICGDYNNVVGLPVGRLYQELMGNSYKGDHKIEN